MLTLSREQLGQEEFGKPVESIMRCEDFKSNFARKLSNRYISRSPVSSVKQDTALKLQPFDNTAENVPDVPERIEFISQLSQSSNVENNGEAVKPPDKFSLKKPNLLNTEVSVLNMEVETLRWQLAQTEANRQMHIALLTQIVTFLNRVKEHMELQKESKTKENICPGRLLAGSFSAADLPRSRSVVHVNNSIESSLSSAKKISTRKISKSISNVNGLKDSNRLWYQSKLSLSPQTGDSAQKISEETTRLISLASSVLNTKLPDLSSTYNNVNDTFPLKEDFNKKINDPVIALKQIEQVLSSSTKISVTNIAEMKSKDIIIQPCSLVALNKKKSIDEDQTASGTESDISTTRKPSTDRKNDFNSHLMEDESGFSSMSSFQEIGIPIISIIPPSPSKEIGFLEDIPDIIEQAEKWKTDTTILDKQSVKVFWV